MPRRRKELVAWPDSKEELLALLQSFHRLQRKHDKQYILSLSIFGVPTRQSEITAVLDAGDRLAAAAELLYEKLDTWS
jgi:hypothetical protein